MVITNNGVQNKNFKLSTLQDKNLKKRQNDEEICDCSLWKDLELTKEEQGLNVQEFDGFKDFMVIYSKNEC